MRFHPRMFIRKMYCTSKLPNFIGSNYMRQVREIDVKKSITVALVGFANAGKSTLINTMLGLNICAASKRPLTTFECQHVFYVEGDTQIILLDTPGILSRELRNKSNFADSEYVIKTKPVQKAHIVGVVVDASCPYARYDVKSHMSFLCNMFPADTEFILILNKVDMLRDKIELLTIAEKFYAGQFPVKTDVELKKRVETRKFSQIFMISALKNNGVEHIVQYLRSIAPKYSGYPPSQISSHPDSKIVEQTVRAALLDCVQKDIPYKCSCEVEYMEGKPSGEFIIVVLIKCPSRRCYHKISREATLYYVEKKTIQNLKNLMGKNVELKLIPLLNKIYKKVQ